VTYNPFEWARQPQKLPLPMGDFDFLLIHGSRLGPTWVNHPNGMSVSSAVLAGLTYLPNRPKDILSDHDTLICCNKPAVFIIQSSQPNSNNNIINSNNNKQHWYDFLTPVLNRPIDISEKNQSHSRIMAQRSSRHEVSSVLSSKLRLHQIINFSYKYM